MSENEAEVKRSEEEAQSGGLLDDAQESKSPDQSAGRGEEVPHRKEEWWDLPLRHHPQEGTQGRSNRLLENKVELRECPVCGNHRPAGTFGMVPGGRAQVCQTCFYRFDPMDARRPTHVENTRTIRFGVGSKRTGFIIAACLLEIGRQYIASGDVELPWLADALKNIIMVAEAAAAGMGGGGILKGWIAGTMKGKL